MSDKIMRSQGYNLIGKGYYFHHAVDEKPWKDSASLRENRTPRTFPIRCPIEKCIWHRRHEGNTPETDSCSRIEAWNILEVEEMEMTENNLDCPWYSGMNRRATLASIQSRTGH